MYHTKSQTKLSFKLAAHDLADLASLQLARVPSCDCVCGCILLIIWPGGVAECNGRFQSSPTRLE